MQSSEILNQTGSPKTIKVTNLSVETSDEDDINQPASSASSTSSSGLSSMNSSAHQSSASESMSSSLQQSPLSTETLDSEVSECIYQLVDSVVSGNMEHDLTRDFKTFRLHEAVYAKTRSNATTSGSSDDDSQLDRGLKHTRRSTSHDTVNEIYNEDITVELELVKEFSLDIESDQLKKHQTIISSIKRSIDSTTENKKESKFNNKWIGQIKPSKSQINWSCPLDDSKLIKSRDLMLVDECLVDDCMVIWLLNSKYKAMSEEQLETTLDDIAIALDEQPSCGEKRNNLIEIKQAIVWICTNELDARRLRCNFHSYLNEVSRESINDNDDSKGSIRQKKLDVDGLLSERLLRRSLPSEKRGLRNNRKSSLLSSSYEQQRMFQDDIKASKEEGKEQVKLFLDSKPFEKGILANSNRQSMRARPTTSLETKATSLTGQTLNGINDHQHHNHNHHRPLELKSLANGESKSPAAIISKTTINEDQKHQRQQTKQTNSNENIVGSNGNSNGSKSSSSSESENKLKQIASDDAKADPKNLLTKSAHQQVVKQQQQQQQQKHKQQHEQVDISKQTILKKSISGIDLRASSDSASSSVTSVGLAGYYRDVASKVLTNGQSKIRKIKDEMISRIPSSSTLSRRTSVVMGQSRSQFGGSVHNLLQPSDDNDGADTTSTSVTMKPAASVSAIPYVESSILKPEAKPRTSILKSKQRCRSIGASSQDLSEALNSDYPRDSVTVNARCDSRNQPTNVQGVKDLRSIQKIKTPKSILKQPSKSTNYESISNDKQVQTPSSLVKRSIYDKSSLVESISDTNNNIGSINDNNNYHHQVSRLNLMANGSKDDIRRRSTYSIARIDFGTQERFTGKNNEFNDDQFEGEPETVSVRSSFERLGKQRASCYDISRLMSKDGITQAQLEKLRSGSIASKSRQRRPPLLLAEESKTNEAEASRCDKLDKRTSIAVGDRPCSIMIDNGKTTSSGSDGMVRAKVGPTQLKRSLTIGSQRKPDHFVHVSRIANIEPKSKDLEHRVQQEKKSEFDPRSLRKPRPSSISSQDSDEVEEKSIVMESSSNNRRPLVRVTASTKKSNREESKKNQPETTKTSLGNDSDEGSSTDVNDEEDESEDTIAPVQTSFSRKAGTFSLLRQSFKQSSLSSVLRFPRASLRVKSITTSSSKQATQPQATTINHKENSNANNDRNSALAIAEANLLAAKQLKQQAQKLIEQQKREREKQQLDQTSLILAAAAAVQYNQQIQRQQQQILYQQAAQQFALGTPNGAQMYDHGIHMQHQMLIAQRQQQQQQSLAYISNLSSAQYMTTAQQMAVIGPISQMPINHIPASQHQIPICMPTSQTIPVSANANHQISSTPGMYSQPMMKGRAKGQSQQKVQSSSHQNIYHQQAGQQLVPMSVNHHSSFNIVYSAPSQVTSMQMQPQQHDVQSTSKQLSLGATMRRTVKSILINRLQGASSHDSKSNLDRKRNDNSRVVVLNSEGSVDSSDGSSNESTPRASPPRLKGILCNNDAQSNHKSPVLKSALKKTYSHTEITSSSSSVSSCSSMDQSRESMHRSSSDKRSTLTKDQAMRYARQSSMLDREHSQAHKSSTTSVGRKNVTFCPKLTSIPVKPI